MYVGDVVKAARSEKHINCQHLCSDCMSVPPCSFSGTRIPCPDCNKSSRSKACFANYKTNKLRGKVFCERKTVCAACVDGITPRASHECLKRFFANLKKNRETGHLCYMNKLADRLPKIDKVLFVFMISKQPKKRKLANPPRNIYQIWSACNCSVRNARMKAT
jgi:hypothetical protein